MEEQTKKESLLQTIIGMPKFWKAQHSDWKVTVIRTSLERLGYQMVYPYLSIYLVALGVSKTKIGIFTCIGLLIAGFLSLFVGQKIDRNGPRKNYLIGIGFLVAAYLGYAVAPVWQVAAVAIIVYYIGSNVSIHSCSAICGNCLKNCDRAKGMMLCESMAAGLLGMIGPSVSAWILLNVIKADDSPTADQIRPLFFIVAAISLVSFIVVFFRLSKTGGLGKTGNASIKTILSESMQVLRENKNTKKWLLISSINAVPTGMVLPYVQVFAKEVKGASVTVLAAMVVVCAVTSAVCGYPFGALADKIGRKKVLYITISLYSLSNLLLVIAPSPAVLILAGILQGFYYIGSPLSAAVSRELVPQSVMGRWIGMTKLINNLFSAVMAVVSGILYDSVGPQYIFLSCIALDMLVRIPLLRSMPETLHEPKEA